MAAWVKMHRADEAIADSLAQVDVRVLKAVGVCL